MEVEAASSLYTIERSERRLGLSHSIPSYNTAHIIWLHLLPHWQMHVQMPEQ